MIESGLSILVKHDNIIAWISFVNMPEEVTSAANKTSIKEYFPIEITANMSYHGFLLLHRRKSFF